MARELACGSGTCADPEPETSLLHSGIFEETCDGPNPSTRILLTANTAKRSRAAHAIADLGHGQQLHDRELSAWGRPAGLEGARGIRVGSPPGRTLSIPRSATAPIRGISASTSIVLSKRRRRPTDRGGRHRHRIDVVPIVLNVLGVEPRPLMRGRDLLAAGADDLEPAIFMETHRSQAEKTLFGLRSARRAVILDVAEKRWELYDLGQDPGQLVNLFDAASSGGRVSHRTLPVSASRQVTA